MLNSSLDGLWLHLALKHTKLHWSFHSYELRCLHSPQLSSSLSDSFVTYRMQCQTSYHAGHKVNMHAHLHDKNNAKQVFESNLSSLNPLQAYSRWTIQQALRTNQEPPSQARPMFISILHWLDKHLHMTSMKCKLYDKASHDVANVYNIKFTS